MISETCPSLWSLWDVLRSYFPIYEIARDLGNMCNQARFRVNHGLGASSKIPDFDKVPDDFLTLVKRVQQECSVFGLNHTVELAKRVISKPLPTTYLLLLSEIDHLNDSLSIELEKEAVFRIAPERKRYFEQDELFGSDVAVAFPSCARDIRNAGSCYALEQEDACVHHLMLVLERGLQALAARVGVPYQQTNWQVIIDQIEKSLKTLPRGSDLDFYRSVNAQFGFLKVAYRNHSQHAHDDPYDMEKALSILNHVRSFMQILEKGGMKE